MRVPNVELKDLPHIITLCGSTKFKKEFEEAAKELSLKGSIILTVSFFTHADNIEITEEQKKMLDALHMRKISISDEIFVINKGGYIGFSTGNEINFAWSREIPVKYLEDRGGIGQKLRGRQWEKSSPHFFVEDDKEGGDNK